MTVKVADTDSDFVLPIGLDFVLRSTPAPGSKHFVVDTHIHMHHLVRRYYHTGLLDPDVHHTHHLALLAIVLVAASLVVVAACAAPFVVEARP